MSDRVRLRVRVRGVVQGVGFRPFVYGLAERHALTGWVLNDDAGVLLEVQGDAKCLTPQPPLPGGRGGETRVTPPFSLLGEGTGMRHSPQPGAVVLSAQGTLGTFLESLRSEAPPLSRVDAVEVARIDVLADERPFEIRASARGLSVSTGIGPDAAPCVACLTELFDPSCRRYRYPFLNCTHCGPRYAITRRLPYDRRETSMAPFAMCRDCQREYEDPRDRRFHAEPTACPVCGPKLTMDVDEVVSRISSGETVAVKGVGGFLLACDASNGIAVERLRAAKERNGKPFAVMFASAASASRYVSLCERELSLLSSPARPIVLARLRDSAPPLPAAIAPSLAWLGVMLPSSPLHYLLFHEAAGRPVGLSWLEEPYGAAFVMTSANPGGAPLVIDDDDAARRLVGIADAICGHNRAIVVRCDDPVVRVIDDATVCLRRGRGFVPAAIPLPREVPSVLAVGGYLKNAVCFTRGDQAFLSQHIGDLDDSGTYRFFEETIAHLQALLETRPALVARDLHPDFLSSRFADALGVPVVAVQHHHAHLAAVLAEHGLSSGFGLALDGVGLGPDGSLWGGELLRVEGARFTRVGHLLPLALPGGDRAAREPWRMAAAVLSKLGRSAEVERRWGRKGAALLDIQRSERLAPETTACGRWFDAAAALLGVRDRSGYEGEAAMVLESLVRRPRSLEGGFRIRDGVLDLLPLFEQLLGMTPEEGADALHGTLAAGLVALAVSHMGGDRTIALGGGCAVNAVLVSELVRRFREHDCDVLLAQAAPPGDGGLALGQAWVGVHSLEGDTPCV